MLEQSFARGVEAEAVRQPVEQLAAEFVLELVDLAVDGARGDVRVLRGLAHRAAAGDFDEVLQDAGVHRTSKAGGQTLIPCTRQRGDERMIAGSWPPSAAPPGEPRPLISCSKNSRLKIAIAARAAGETLVEMAWVGQTDTQTPQSMHWSGWMYSVRPPV